MCSYILKPMALLSPVAVVAIQQQVERLASMLRTLAMWVRVEVVQSTGNAADPHHF